MSKLTGKVAIGAGIARSFAAAGASVVVNYASSREGAERVVADIQRQGGKAAAVQGDVAKAADIRRLFERTEELFGAADILVNNAGVYEFAPLDCVSETEFHRQFDTNVLGILLASREAARRFGEAGGSIINVSSVVSDNPLPNKVGLIGTETEKAFVAGTPLGRIGQPIDIAQVALFLASDDAAWVTGERISTSGGLR